MSFFSFSRLKINFCGVVVSRKKKKEQTHKNPYQTLLSLLLKLSFKKKSFIPPCFLFSPPYFGCSSAQIKISLVCPAPLHFRIIFSFFFPENFIRETAMCLFLRHFFFQKIMWETAGVVCSCIWFFFSNIYMGNCMCFLCFF